MLHLSEADVERLLPMSDALTEVEAGLRALGEGKAENRPRQRVRGAHAILNVMVASWPERGYYGFKYYTASKEGIRFWVHLFDGSTGVLVAVIEANRLGQRRTGAASGVATKYLARADATTLGLVGTGWQAESQLEAVAAVRPLCRIRCTSRNHAHCTAFAQRMGRSLGIDVVPMDSVEDTVRDTDIVVAATDSHEPVLRGAWLAPGTHINAIGANRIDSRELDDMVIRRSTFVAVDSIEQAHAEAGDLVRPAQDGVVAWDQVHSIGDVVAGSAPSRRSAEEITLFKSLGIAVEDLAVAAFVYERARREGVGADSSP